MAVLTNANCVELFRDGRSDTTVLYALRNVTTGDTFDCASQLSGVKRAVILGTTVAGSEAVSTITGTVITIPAGISSDAGWMLAYGPSA